MLPSVTVGVCAHRRYRGAKRSIASLPWQGLDPNTFRLLVVGNLPDASCDAENELGDSLERARTVTVVREQVLGGIERPQPGVQHLRV